MDTHSVKFTVSKYIYFYICKLKCTFIFRGDEWEGNHSCGRLSRGAQVLHQEEEAAGVCVQEGDGLSGDTGGSQVQRRAYWNSLQL